MHILPPCASAPNPEECPSPTSLGKLEQQVFYLFQTLGGSSGSRSVPYSFISLWSCRLQLQRDPEVIWWPWISKKLKELAGGVGAVSHLLQGTEAPSISEE